MTDFPLDIIIPVWNSPVAVRVALASFAADSPTARLVMVNNGSERETEAILHEFAEALDDRALLLSTGRNIGTVAAVNLGISRSSAPLALIASPFVRLTAGWLEPVLALFDRMPAAGAVSLRSSQGGGDEADHGSFTAMVLRRELLLQTAGFDEQMDGADWALRDFARRATLCGYTTHSLFSSRLLCDAQQEFGSPARREQRARASRQLYVSRWGEPAAYLLNCSDSYPDVSSAALREMLLTAARQGDRITLTAAGRAGRRLAEEGFPDLHENIALHALPRFFHERALHRLVERLSREDAAIKLISDDAAASWPLTIVSYAEFAAGVKERLKTHYQGGVHV